MTRAYTRLGKTDSWRTQTKRCAHRTREKEQWPHKKLTQISPWVSRSLRKRPGSEVACCRVRAENAAWDLLKEVTIIFITSTKFGLRSSNREGTQPCPSKKIGLKIYWTWPRPSEQDPVSPSVSLSYQEASISLLSSIRGQTEWKPQWQTTNQTDHMDHSLV